MAFPPGTTGSTWDTFKSSPSTGSFLRAPDASTAMAAGPGRESLIPILQDRVAYTRTYFAADEGTMRVHRCLGMAEQQAGHARLTRHVLHFPSEFNAGKTALTVQVMQLLKDWLVNHIAAGDRAFGAWQEPTRRTAPVMRHPPARSGRRGLVGARCAARHGSIFLRLG